MKTLLLATCVVLFFPVLIGTTTTAVATAPRNAPAKPLFAWVPEGGFPDAFPFGQCTWWGAYNREVTWGGNARDWLSNAKAQGVATADYPSIGAIVVYKPGGEYSDYGHVAIVIQVTPRSYTVSEMNAPAWGKVSTRVIAWPDPNVQGFIPVRAHV